MVKVLFSLLLVFGFVSFSKPPHHPPGLSIASDKAVENGKKQLRKRHCKQAIHEFEKAVRKDPRNFEAQYWLAVAESMCGYDTQAIERLRITIDLAPSNVWSSRVYASIGVILYSLGRMEESKIYLEKARKIYPENEFAIEWKQRDKDSAFSIMLRWLDY